MNINENFFLIKLMCDNIGTLTGHCNTRNNNDPPSINMWWK